jgi:hypothetical protein
MAITYPLDILADFPGWSTDFSLQYRQEQSRTAGGTTYVKDLGNALWRATYASRIMRPNELDKWRAILDGLENGLQRFKGYALSRCYPIAYPNGSWPMSGWFSARKWDFTADVEGWTALGGTLSAAAGIATFTSSSSDSGILSNEASLAVDGSKYKKVRMRARRTTGSGPLAQRQLYFWTGAGLQSPPATAASPADPSAWNIIEWDMSNDARWTGAIVNNIRIDVGTTGDVIEIDWIDIGNDTFFGEAKIASLGGDNKSLSLANLPVGFTLNVGDMLQIQHGTDPVRYDLHRVQEGAAADASGITPAFEVRPHLWPGVAVDNVVSVKAPWCLMQIVPDTIESTADMQTGNGTITFQAMEARD